MMGTYLGPKFENSEVETQLNICGANFKKLNEDDMIELVATALVEKKAIGWMQGRMEFGPRALGGRSIIADPRSPEMQKQLNFKVKFRESFRPFAPSILSEHVGDWFDINIESPYMLFVAKVNKQKQLPMTENEKKLFGIEKLNIPRSSIPAITHVDYSARVQTVHFDTNPRFYKLINKFYQKTGCPIIVNTSFNVRGEPIVCTPTDAFRCFMGTELDILVVEDFVIQKKEQNTNLNKNYIEKYELD
jgi:carbamoyltransferase